MSSRFRAAGEFRHCHNAISGAERDAGVVFLGVNGHDFSATEAEVVTEILALADGRVSEAALADWVRQHTRKLDG